MRHDMGGPAFPRSQVSEDYGNGIVALEGEDGMLLWDYYAAAALTGFTSASDEEGCWTGDSPRAAIEAALIADQMLIERQKRMKGGSDAA